MLGASDNSMTVKDGDFPFYTQEDPPVRLENQRSSSSQQGPGSGFDSDTIHGMQAVSAKAWGPNKLVATGRDGKLPLDIIP